MSFGSRSGGAAKAKLALSIAKGIWFWLRPEVAVCRLYSRIFFAGIGVFGCSSRYTVRKQPSTGSDPDIGT